MVPKALSFVLLCAVASAVPEFVVNLDLQPEDRWRDVMSYYLKSGMLHSFTKFMAANTDLFPQLKADRYEEWRNFAMSHVPEEYRREALGMAQMAQEFDPPLNQSAQKSSKLDMDLAVERIVLSAFTHERLARSPSGVGLLVAMVNGTTIHARTMDTSLQFEHEGRLIGYSDLIVNVMFTRNGEPLFTSVTLPFQLGIHTAMRFNGWAFQQNSRFTGNDVLNNLESGREGGLGYQFFARQVMEETPDFDTAVTRFYTGKLMAPSYFVLSGTEQNQGVVLSVDRMGKHYEGSLKLMHLGKGKGLWHLLQTNDDIGESPRDHRRPIEDQMLIASRQDKASAFWLAEHIRQKPLSTSMTIFTWIAVPRSNFYKVLLPGDDAAGIPDIDPFVPRMRSSVSKHAKRLFRHARSTLHVK